MADITKMPWAALALGQLQNLPQDADGIPAYLAAPTPQAANPAPAAKPAPKKVPTPIPVDLPPNVSSGFGLSGYIQSPEEKELIAGYDQNAKQALVDQNANLDMLNEYINTIAQKPTGINWTPLAAYIDSVVPNSKLTAAAQAMAPMSQETKDQMLFDLRNKLQKGRGEVSKEHLQQLRDQLNMIRYGNQFEHWQNQDAAAAARAGSASGRKDVMEGNQAFQAVKSIHDDSGIKVMRQQARNIDKGLELLNKPQVSNKMVAEVAQDFSAALSGKMAASDFKLKEILTPTLLGKIADYKAFVESNPDQPAPPHVVAFWNEMGMRLNEAYDRQLHAAGVGKTAGLKTAFKKTPIAYAAATEAAELYKNGKWRTAGLDPEEKGSDAKTQVYNGVTYKMVGDHWEPQ